MTATQVIAGASGALIGYLVCYFRQVKPMREHIERTAQQIRFDIALWKEQQRDSSEKAQDAIRRAEEVLNRARARRDGAV